MLQRSASHPSPKSPPPAELLLANLPSPVLALDPELRVAAVNPAAEQLFSASARMLLGRPVGEFLAPHARFLDLARQVQSEGRSLSDYGMELALARGEAVAVDCHLAPIVERPGTVLAVLHPCSVAHRFDPQRAQRGSGRSIAGLAATLAHEVKNPLSGIRGAAQLLEPVLAPEDRPLVALICAEVDRIVGLVERMEAFGESVPLERRPVNVHQVLDHVRRLAESGFARHVRFQEAYDPSLPEVEGDRDRLVQAFLNLVKNAAEALTGEGGVITLSTHFRHGFRMAAGHSGTMVELPITIEVKDNGPGIPPEIRDHLFEPFVTTKPKGRGLGLALVAKIVADHGGVVSVEDGEPGTVVRVRLPAAPQRSTARGKER
ncbi:MAG: ATP-binding protein [Geminicoccaceae bacterium]|nr:ATP-binding protein [Geminicoccaceae bacterium]MCS7268205.1 ATP-binding protein [Geminicoccaceae bacterium]MCX7631176.1 ATP-binding protein [Geminicoccaceae bacterium]MDW8125025.1 ATP-binding protein [Geminicoccaceae bacterium]MDW8341236.1 ATP-binding protein [Geminicoccaceae bacterium]